MTIKIGKIESNIPIPPPRRRTGLTEQLRAMEVGQSFVVRNEQRFVVYSCARHAGVRVSMRRVEGDVEGRLRVWRIS